MTDRGKTRTFKLGDRVVKRLGYGSHAARRARACSSRKRTTTPRSRCCARRSPSGVSHIDTSDFYGPHVTNENIADALHPYPKELVIVTKIGARRGPYASWNPAMSPDDLKARLRTICATSASTCSRSSACGSWARSTDPPKGPSRRRSRSSPIFSGRASCVTLGSSNVTSDQIEQGRRICDIVCVQNHYNIAHREDDDLIDALAKDGIAYAPFFPLGGFTPLQSTALSDVAERLGVTPMQVALAWLLQRAPNILLIPGTSSLGHLRENLAGRRAWKLPGDAMAAAGRDRQKQRAND